MKPSELRLAFIIAAALLICACSSTRKAVEETSASHSADSLSINAAASASSVSSTSFSSLLNTSRQLNLADIRIEFFPPDSSRPDGSPAVRSLSIGSAAEDSRSSASQSATADSAAIYLGGNGPLREELAGKLRRFVTSVMPLVFPSEAFRTGGREAMESPFELVILPLCE